MKEFLLMGDPSGLKVGTSMVFFIRSNEKGQGRVKHLGPSLKESNGILRAD